MGPGPPPGPARDLCCGRAVAIWAGHPTGTWDLSPGRTGPTPAGPPGESANVEVAEGEGNPRGNRRGTGPDSDGRRDRTGERRTTGNQKKAGDGEEPGGQTKGNRRKARTGTGGREVRPQTAR